MEITSEVHLQQGLILMQSAEIFTAEKSVGIEILLIWMQIPWTK